ncbi:MAG TPA: Obg family GTPase CgtA, partial [bacterium]|nr:Obg family GTPase CgtA [bacterium]
HIERTRFLVHMIDIQSLDPVNDYYEVRQELEKFSTNLSQKPYLICFTKLDTVGWDLNSPGLKDYIQDFSTKINYHEPIFVISAISKTGLKTLLNKIQLEVSRLPISNPTIIVPQKIDQPSSVHQIDAGIFQIIDQKIERFATRTDFSNYESVDRLRDILFKKGYYQKIKSMGAKPGDLIKIGQYQLEW